MAYQQQQRHHHHQNWQVSESGILRKKEENEEELLVFGYSCKLFRDDEKALYIDQGKHLIPWMGNDSLKIDRYDVRGALYDLSQYEAIAGHQDETFWVTLSNEERKIEQMCNEERYRALVHNEDEEALYQEEELKRLHQALGGDKGYGQVSYKYDEEKNGESSERKPDDNAQNEDVDEPFTAPPELDIPQGMVLPDTVKLNAIIEKTAMFIYQQGSQMEILLKMKQAGNPQFEFLSFNCPLHAYYRHVLMAIKTGRYRPKIPNAAAEQKSNEEKQQANDPNYYLHHTLASSSSLNVAPSIPSISYKPSEDCAYSMLVNKIKGKQNKFSALLQTTVSTIDKNSDSVGENSNSNDMVLGPSELLPKKEEKISTVLEKEVCSKVIVDEPKNENDDADRNNSHTNEDSSESITLKRESPVPPVTRPPKRRKRKRPQGGCAYIDIVEDDTVMTTVPEAPEEDLEIVEEKPYFEAPEQPLEPENEKEMVIVEEETQPKIDIPPADLQLIIDKMASYVVKNGRNFEDIVRSKGDPRFYFLNPANQYYMYYSKQVEHYENLARPPGETLDKDTASAPILKSTGVENMNNDEGGTSADKDINKERVNSDNDGVNSTEGSTRSGIIKPTPVCFSIKKPKETEGLEIKSALPIEESSEEEDEEGGGGGNNGGGGGGEASSDEPTEVIDKGQTTSTNGSTKVIDKSSSENSSTNKKATSSVQPEKWAEERVKDKLAAAAREKLLVKEREKQLQLERKRRAAAFLNLLQKEGLTKEKDTPPTVIGPQLPQEEGDGKEEKSGTSDSDESISSPPSSVTSPEVVIEKHNVVTGESKKRRPSISTDITSSGFNLKPAATYLPGSLEEELRNREESEIRRKHKKRKSSKSSRKQSLELRLSSSSSRRRHGSSKEERHHHRKHRHGRRRHRGMSSTGAEVVAEREHHHHHHHQHHHERAEVEVLSSSSSRHRRHHRHRHKYYKVKKHKRKETKKEKSESSESSEASGSD